MRVRTFRGADTNVEAELIRGPNANGLCIVKFDDGRLVARALAGVVPLDEGARKMLAAVDAH